MEPGVNGFVIRRADVIRVLGCWYEGEFVSEFTIFTAYQAAITPEEVYFMRPID